MMRNPFKIIREHDQALKDATALANALHRKHYPDAPGWRPLPDLVGVLSQIDNMTAMLERRERP